MSNSFMETVSRWGRRGTAGTSIAASLAFEDVVHGYGKVRALDGISLAVAPGEVVCLLGPSGCGKTTLLRIASGIERPLSGRVTIVVMPPAAAARPADLKDSLCRSPGSQTLTPMSIMPGARYLP